MRGSVMTSAAHAHIAPTSLPNLLNGANQRSSPSSSAAIGGASGSAYNGRQVPHAGRQCAGADSLSVLANATDHPMSRQLCHLSCAFVRICTDGVARTRSLGRSRQGGGLAMQERSSISNCQGRGPSCPSCPSDLQLPDS